MGSGDEVDASQLGIGIHAPTAEVVLCPSSLLLSCVSSQVTPMRGENVVKQRAWTLRC